MYTPLGPPGSHQPPGPRGGRRCGRWLVTPLAIAQYFSNTFGRGPKNRAKDLRGPLMSQMFQFSND